MESQALLRAKLLTLRTVQQKKCITVLEIKESLLYLCCPCKGIEFFFAILQKNIDLYELKQLIRVLSELKAKQKTKTGVKIAVKI